MFFILFTCLRKSVNSIQHVIFSIKIVFQNSVFKHNFFVKKKYKKHVLKNYFSKIATKQPYFSKYFDNGGLWFFKKVWRKTYSSSEIQKRWGKKKRRKKTDGIYS